MPFSQVFQRSLGYSASPIYDVTDVPAWKGGVHNGHQAGADLTKEIKGMSPHGTSVLKKLKVVGRLVDGK